MPRKKENNIVLTKSQDGKSYTLDIKLSKEVEGTPQCKESHQGWINYGKSNDYPKRMAELYYSSPTHQACVDFLKTAILAGGLDYTGVEDIMPNPDYSWEQLIDGIATDYALYGGFAVQVIKNKDDKTFSFYHQPFDEVRRAEDKKGYFISHDWKKLSQNPATRVESLVGKDELKLGKIYLLYHHDYAPATDNIYPVPLYMTASNSIQTEIELIRYDLRSVLNNFSASGILTLNNIDDDNEKEDLVQNIQKLFVGSANANSLIINFKNNDDETPAVFTRIDKDAGNNVNLFEQLNERVTAKIISAHKITSKGLVGLDLSGASLGGDGNTLNVAFKLYEALIAKQKRRVIENVINRAFELNGIKTDLMFKPLNFSISNTNATEEKEEGNEQ